MKPFKVQFYKFDDEMCAYSVFHEEEPVPQSKIGKMLQMLISNRPSGKDRCKDHFILQDCPFCRVEREHGGN